MKSLFKKESRIIESSYEIKLKGEVRAILKNKLTNSQFKSVLENGKKILVYKIVYWSNSHRVIGFIVKPKNIKKELPCIIWNRGGSKDFGAIKLGQLFLDLAKLSLRGYIVIASQYSGSSGSDGVDEMGGEDIHDVLNLYEILKKCRHANISRVGMYGHSRGGMMTYLALAKVRWIKAAVIQSAPTDEVSAVKFRPGWEKHQKEMYGGSKKEKIKRSALYWPEKLSKKSPILLVHGTADWRVNPEDSVRMALKLFQNKIPFRLVMLEGADHGLSEFRKEEEQLTYDWFERFLKKKEKIPNLKFHGK